MNEQEQSLTVIQNPAAPVLGETIWNTPALMGEAFKMAEMLSRANILPQAYRGNPGDCLVAIDMANRMGISPLMVMQQSQIVKGNFTWKGTACKSFIDGCGKFRRSRYEFVGTEGADNYGCRLVAERVSTGETVKGPPVTIALAKAEGWHGKDGSKWRTMPDLMLRYRAASFFAKTECPEVLMGFQTAEEMGDILRVDPDAPEPEAVACEDCGNVITPTEREADVGRIITYGRKRWGANLCADCQRRRRAEAAQKSVDAPPAMDEWNTAPEQEAQQGEDTAQMSVL